MNLSGSVPPISVVMSVHNGSSRIAKTISSVLNQSFANFRFLIVNDGSTDDTQQILARFAAEDSRILVINTSNQGLTRALNQACAMAMGEFIARQDVGDISLPQRLERQFEFLNANPDVVAVGCGARRITENGELLGVSMRTSPPELITKELCSSGTGILHPASMYRTKAFFEAGGYRPEFRFAQDTDLWLRLSERGFIAEIPEVLFELIVDDHGISATRNAQQVKLWELARKCAEARRNGEPEESLLKNAEVISGTSPKQLSPSELLYQRRKARYFIGSQLYAQGNSACRRYFLDSLRVPSLLLPSAAKILMSFSKCR